MPNQETDPNLNQETVLQVWDYQDFWEGVGENCEDSVRTWVLKRIDAWLARKTSLSKEQIERAIQNVKAALRGRPG